jgi:hypothetical protein
MPIGINPAFPVAGSPTTSSVRDNFSAAKSGIDRLQYATVDAVTATGTADAMVATYVINPTLVDGLEITVKSIGANTVAGPTVSLASGPAIPLYTNEGNALPIGGIPSADYYIRLRYDADNSHYIVMNPAVTTDASLAQTITDVVEDDLVGVSIQAYDADTAFTDVAQSFTEEQTFKTVKETVYTFTSSSGNLTIDPSNGTIQLKTLTAATTFSVANFDEGHSVTLMLGNPNDAVITWPPIYWANSSEPVLQSTGLNTVIIWKVGSTLYGSSAGTMGLST